MPDTPHIWILNYWGGTRTLYLSITHSNSSTSPFLKQQMAPYANPNYANGCFARFQKVFCVVPQCIVTFLWNQIKFQKQVMPCWHLNLTSCQLLGCGWLIQPFLHPCILCSFSANLSKWIRVELAHYFLMTSILFPQPQTVKGFIHKLWAIPGSNEYSHTKHKHSGMWFPVTKAPHSPGSSSRGTCTLGPRSATWVSVHIRNGCLNQGWDFVKLVTCVVSQKRVWQISILCLTFSLECQFPQVGP